MSEAILNNILHRLEELSDPQAVEGISRFGINTHNAYGISITQLREISKEIGKDHEIALRLWRSNVHEAKLLASMIDEPPKVSEKQMDEWAEDFDSWDVCDQCCNNLFRKTEFAYKKIDEWSYREEEFVKRAAFSLMASLAVHDKKADDKRFEDLLVIVKREASDSRHYVKKAVNWALRQIGKRNLHLNEKAIETAEEIQRMDTKSARWIASDALKELTSEDVLNKLKKKEFKAGDQV